MKLYRDLTEGETLQPGDEKLGEPLNWEPVDPVFFGAKPGARFRPEYRRPVDAVPREEYEKLHQGLAQAERLLYEAVEGAEPMNAELANLRQQLAQERVEHARTMRGRDTLRAELDEARDLIRQMEIM